LKTKWEWKKEKGFGSAEATRSQSERRFVPGEEALPIPCGFAPAESSCRRAASSSFPRRRQALLEPAPGFDESSVVVTGREGDSCRPQRETLYQSSPQPSQNIQVHRYKAFPTETQHSTIYLAKRPDFF